ncbi:MAG: DAK2 domain-containing protein [Spirochaetales bacterium]|nr:DAK2 domain-containing protein [Spirochaetales bacterium]
MAIKTLGGKMYARMIIGGSKELDRNRQIVNDLNVFPIPDGDTGDNMFMTANGGSEALETDNENLTEVSRQVSQGMFMGARGNSGVILSRIFKGISLGLSDVENTDTAGFLKALRSGVDESYKAVAQPVEGTILTVFRCAVEAAASQNESTFEELFKVLNAAMRDALEKTPTQLEVLRQAGVVDSGGAGLVYIFHGMEKALNGEQYEENTPTRVKDNGPRKPDLSKFNESSDLTYGYCTEFILQLMTAKVGDVSKFDEQPIFDYLNQNGESVVAFRDGSIIRVHIHTKTPGEILNHCQIWGEFLTLKIENMTIQHNQSIVQNNYSAPEEDIVLRTGKPKKKYATVTVATGEGICNLFREIGVDAVINGGQSMNPSVRDFQEAFDTIEAENIIVFPNNGNVILTAKQIADVYDKANIIVIPNKDLGTGYAAISMLDTSKDDPEEVVASIEESIQGVITAMVSKANRDTEQDGVEIRNGDYIGFADDVVYTDSPNRRECCEKLLYKLNSGDYSILMLIKGKDVPQDEAEDLAGELENRYKLTEIIPIDGGQPIHDYVIILEE